MKEQDAIRIFEDKDIRVLWDTNQEKWFISVIDVIEILTNSDRPRKYWSDLKIKLKKEGSELSDKIGQLKMPAPDGKMRLTDVADSEQVFRLIQSIFYDFSLLLLEKLNYTVLHSLQGLIKPLFVDHLLIYSIDHFLLKCFFEKLIHTLDSKLSHYQYCQLNHGVFVLLKLS